MPVQSISISKKFYSRLQAIDAVKSLGYPVPKIHDEPKWNYYKVRLFEYNPSKRHMTKPSGKKGIKFIIEY